MNATSKMPSIQLTPMEAISGWKEFSQDGEGYLKTAIAGHERRQDIFTSEILYNIIAMAIEKFAMAALMRHGAMPYNHTMVDLVEAMEETFPHAIEEIRDGLIALDKYQEICDVDAFSIVPPNMDEIPGMLELAEKLRSLVIDELLQHHS